MEDTYNDLNNYIQFKTNEVKMIHLEWFPSLQEFCSLLSTHFQRFLTSFGCSGFIKLEVGESQVNIVYLLMLLAIILS